MVIDVITLFPYMFDGILKESIVKRALEKKLVKINLHNLRNYSSNKHKKVDDRSFGGGPGMVLTPQPIFDAVNTLRRKNTRVILLCPKGELYNQKISDKLKEFNHIILICGHYEGVDERVRNNLIDFEISIGNYILTGGEIPAMIIIDSVVRLIPGVLGNEESIDEETFNGNKLEYPQYTRPENFRGLKVPKVLLSGNHENIKKWRYKQAVKYTKEKRPELMDEK